MEHAISSDLIRGHIDTIILHTLLGGDKFAQQISDSIEQKSDGQYKINQATLYSSLKRLEGLKYVSSYWYDSVGGRRNVFKLSASGKTTVEDNLSSWSFSRAIIDKLMDCEPQPIYKTQIVEKIIEIEKKVVDTTPPTQIIKQTSDDTTNTDQNAILSIKNKETEDDKQEINFRNILNGLIKTTTKQKTEQPTELKPLNKNDRHESISEKASFNETLTATDYNAQKENNNGKIDFGDITLKAAKEGYKIRISSKDSAISEGTLLVNKVNLFSAVVIMFITIIEAMYFTIKYNSILNVNIPIILGLSAVIMIHPFIRLINFLRNPSKTTPKNISVDIILTSAIVIFNLLLITFAANLLSNVDFSNKSTILLSLIIPTVVYIDTFAYFLLKFLFARSNTCKLKIKK